MTTAAKRTSRIRFDGLDALSLDGLLAGGSAQTTSEPTLIKVPLDRIRFNAGQVRSKTNPGFSDESVQALAESMRSGLKTPIIVGRKDAEGYYALKAGERRCRAAMLLGWSEINAVIDDSDEDPYTEAIENIARESLTPMEIARFIRARVQAGDTQADIARRLSLSRTTVSVYASLMELPEQAQELLHKREMETKVGYQLARLERERPGSCAEFLAGQDFSRRAMQEFMARIGQGAGEQAVASERAADGGIVAQDALERVESPVRPQQNEQAARSRARRFAARVLVCHQGQTCVLRTDLRPSERHRAWLQDLAQDQDPFEVALAEVRLEAIDG